MRTLNLFAAIKRKLPVFGNGSPDRKALAFFIEYCRHHKNRFEALAVDHEPDEMRIAMTSYENYNRHIAKISMLMHPSIKGYDELVIDNISTEEKEKRFFDAIDWADSHDDVYSRTCDRISLVKAYIRTYGPPSDASVRKIKAEAAGDYELAALF